MEVGTSMTDSNLKDYNNFYDSLIPHSFPTDFKYLLKVFFLHSWYNILRFRYIGGKR